MSSECPEWHQMLTNQSCPAGKHPDWFIDSEHNHRCPWCEVERLRAVVAAALAWIVRVDPYPEKNGDMFRELRAILAAAVPTEPAGGEKT